MTSKYIQKVHRTIELCQAYTAGLEGIDCAAQATHEVRMSSITLGQETARTRWLLCDMHADRMMKVAKQLGVEGA